MSPFKAGGPLSNERAAIYIEREADRDVLTYLQAMEYLMLIEPRQQGKTSLLAQLRAKSAPQTVFGYIEVEDLAYENQQAWFADLWDELLLALEFIEEGAVKPPTNVKQWRNCLRFIASLAEKQSRQIVIALDEVGSMMARLQQKKIVRQAMHRNKTYWDYQPHFDATQQYMRASADDPYMRK